MKKFLKYIAIIAIVFIADFFSKTALLGFLAAKYGNMIYDINKICAKCNIEGVFVSWKYILWNFQFV